MTKQEYILLYEKFNSGNCTDEEIKLLEEYQDDFSLDTVYWDKTKLGDEQVVTGQIYQKLRTSIKKQQPGKLQWYKLPLAAAVILAAISFAVYLYLQPQDRTLQQEQLITANIVPGRNKAILILEDGSQIILDNSADGILASRGAAVIRIENNGKLIYKNALLSRNQQIKYNTIVIPRGGEYQLVLPDGTKVWLNAASSLRFPIAFTGGNRKVELTGEAYFEVVKNKAKPFFVLTNGTEVKVLGTHFNVNSYANEVNTTLLEGSVRLKSAGDEVLLKPGQSGIRQEKGGFKVKSADTEAVVAWKGGYFVFHDENIENIMEKISRWYDVDVEYQGNVKSKEFYGKVSRYDGVYELLKNMELTGIVKFKIIPGQSSGKGRRIIVMEN